MATVQVTHHFADGDECRVSVQVATSYPDALAEAKATAVAALGEAVEMLLSIDREDGDE